jgi:integron integrase
MEVIMTSISFDKHGAAQKPRLLDEVRAKIRTLHYSRRTEKSYTQWVKRYILFHGKRHPREMGAAEVQAFLSALATERHVSASTQNQALAALLFLYREVLAIELPWLDDVVRAKPRQRLPVVLTRNEVQRLLDRLEGTHGLMARLMYGTGMRLMECVTLRIKDVDFERSEITVRNGKGGKDRITLLPQSLAARLREHLARVHTLYEEDRHADQPGVWLPDALEGNIRTRVNPGVGSGFFRQQPCPRTLARASGVADVSTTMIYTHVLNRGGRGVVSPLDQE